MERAAVPSMIREQRLNQWIENYSDSILRTCFLYLSDQTQAEDGNSHPKSIGSNHYRGFVKNKVVLIFYS